MLLVNSCALTHEIIHLYSKHSFVLFLLKYFFFSLKLCPKYHFEKLAVISSASSEFGRSLRGQLQKPLFP